MASFASFSRSACLPFLSRPDRVLLAFDTEGRSYETLRMCGMRAVGGWSRVRHGIEVDYILATRSLCSKFGKACKAVSPRQHLCQAHVVRPIALDWMRSSRSIKSLLERISVGKHSFPVFVCRAHQLLEIRTPMELLLISSTDYKETAMSCGDALRLSVAVHPEQSDCNLSPRQCHALRAPS
jgi:hypothetical protein